MDETEFKEKARRLLFNSGLKDSPVVFEMYLRSFGLKVDPDKELGQILAIIRASADANTAFTMVCHHLDSLEG
jgi:hypothetical protein